MQRTEASLGEKTPRADLQTNISTYTRQQNSDLSCTVNANIRVVKLLLLSRWGWWPTPNVSYHVCSKEMTFLDLGSLHVITHYWNCNIALHFPYRPQPIHSTVKQNKGGWGGVIFLQDAFSNDTLGWQFDTVRLTFGVSWWDASVQKQLSVAVFI